VQTCLSIATAVGNGCGPAASLRTGKRLGSPPYEQPLSILHHRADAGLGIIKW
jgi:hypothetical protein